MVGKSLFGRIKKAKALPPATSTSTLPSSSSSLAPSPSFIRRVQNSDDLRHVFDKFDANGDGRISLSELEQVLRSLGGGAEEAEAMMREADTDGDGFISLEEFVAVNRTGEGDAAACMEDLRLAFGVYDRDGNGVISAEELHHVLRSMGEKASLSACRSMIRSVDRNGDGAVNFDEFLLMMGGRSAPTTPHA